MLWLISGITHVELKHFAYLVESDEQPSCDVVDTILHRYWPEDYEEEGYMEWKVQGVEIVDLPSKKDVETFFEEMDSVWTRP